MAGDGVVDSRPSALQRAAVLSEALRLQYRLARGAQAHDLQLRRAARIPDQARLAEPRRHSQASLRGISAASPGSGALSGRARGELREIEPQFPNGIVRSVSLVSTTTNTKRELGRLRLAGIGR